MQYINMLEKPAVALYWFVNQYGFIELEIIPLRG